MVDKNIYFTFKTWLKHVMIKCVLCGESKDFTTQPDGDVHFFSEMVQWVDGHWKNVHNEGK